jgi:hypothetical protein
MHFGQTRRVAKVSSRRGPRSDLPLSADTVYLRRLRARGMARSLSPLWVLPTVLFNAVLAYLYLVFSLFGATALGDGHLNWKSWAFIVGIPIAVLASMCLAGFMVARVIAHYFAGLQVLFVVPSWVLGLLATLGAAGAVLVVAVAFLSLPS